MSLDDLTLADFKNRVGVGTRANRYSVSMGIPTNNHTLQAEVSAASLPGAELPAIPVPFRGRILKIPGDRPYSTWTFTVYDQPAPATTEGSLDTGTTAWDALHAWSNAINNHEDNTTNWSPDATEGGGGYVADWTIHHYDLNGNEIKQVKLHNCWPTLVGPIDLAAGVMDSLVQFSCSVEYEYFTVKTDSDDG